MHEYSAGPPEPPHWIVRLIITIWDIVTWPFRVPEIGLCAVACLALTMYLVGCFKSPEYYENKGKAINVERDLISFANGAKVGGDFVLGFGSIEHRFIYAYMYKTKNGGVKQDYVYVDNATLYEDGDDRAYIRCVKDNRLGVPERQCTELRYATEVAIHIPKKSIVREFNVDINR